MLPFRENASLLKEHRKVVVRNTVAPSRNTLSKSLGFDSFSKHLVFLDSYIGLESGSSQWNHGRIGPLPSGRAWRSGSLESVVFCASRWAVGKGKGVQYWSNRCWGEDSKSTAPDSLDARSAKLFFLASGPLPLAKFTHQVVSKHLYFVVSGLENPWMSRSRYGQVGSSREVVAPACAARPDRFIWNETEDIRWVKDSRVEIWLEMVQLTI